MKNVHEQASPIVAQATEHRKSFSEKLRAFEKAWNSGADYSVELYDLATAVAKAVINKCVDPQRKTAAQLDRVSANGMSPALVALKVGIDTDRRLLDNTRENANKATATRYNDNGDLVTEVVNADAESAFNALITECLSDGIDLVQQAAAALIEQAAEHGHGEKWLETPYNIRRISRKVYIHMNDTKEYREENTTPIQEVYREVRREIAKSRAVQIDPRNGYTYIEDMGGADGLEETYIRLGKWADLGGEDMNGNYTADMQTAQDYEAVISALNLTDRQMQIIGLRMRGHGYKAIATALGVNEAGIKIQVRRLRERCAALGFTPSMWNEMTKGE